LAIKSANPKSSPVRVSINFSFPKLAGRIQKIIVDTVNREKQGIVEVSKKTIKNRELQPLSDSTIGKRRSGTSDYKKRGHRPSPTTDDTPLHYTGSLYKSIKVSDKGIDMLDYGISHDQGKGEPQREFIAKPHSPKMQSKEEFVVKKLYIDLHKNLMRGLGKK